MATRIVTFLGTGNRRDFPETLYDPVYYDTGRQVYGPTSMHDLPTVIEAAGPVCLVVLGTAKVRGIWFDHAAKYETTLRADLATAGFAGDLTIEFREISEGATEAERWGVFRCIAEVLDPAPLPGESAAPTHQVVDITHGFRSQPFFAAAAIAFVQAERNRRWQPQAPKAPAIQILYGAYEARDLQTKTAPIWDMTQFLEVARWNTALDGLMRYGRADDLGALLQERETHARIGAKTRDDHQALTPLRDFRTAAVAFAEGLVTARVPELLTSLAGRLADKAGSARDLIAAWAPPVLAQLDELKDQARRIHAPKAIGKAGLRASLELANLYQRLQRFSELSALVRETYVSAWSLARRRSDLLQPASPTFDDQRQNDDRALGHQGHTLKAGLPGAFGAFTRTRNDIQHCGFNEEPGRGDQLRKKLGEAIAQLDDELTQTGLFAAADPLFVNCTNHPSTTWHHDQRTATLNLGHGPIHDVPFPPVPPAAEPDEIDRLAQKLAGRILSLPTSAAFVAGEHSLTFALVRRLQSAGVACYVATTERVASEEIQPDGSIKKTSEFRFVAWRRYPDL